MVGKWENDKGEEEKDAFERWLPVGLAVASVILLIVAGYEIASLFHLL